MEAALPPTSNMSPEPQDRGEGGLLSSGSTDETSQASTEHPSSPSPGRKGNQSLFPQLRQQGILNVDELLLPLPDDPPVFQNADISAAPTVSYLMRRAQRARSDDAPSAPEVPPQASREAVQQALAQALQQNPPQAAQQTIPQPPYQAPAQTPRQQAPQQIVQQTASTPSSELGAKDPSPAAAATSYSLRRAVKEGAPRRTQEKLPTPPEKSVWDNITFSRSEAGSAPAARPAPYRLRKTQTGDPWRTPSNTSTPEVSRPASAYSPLLPPPDEPLQRPRPTLPNLRPLLENSNRVPVQTTPFASSPPGGAEDPAPRRTLWRNSKGPKAAPNRYSIVPGVEDEVLLPLDFDEVPFIPELTPPKTEKRPYRRPIPPWPRAHQTPAARRSTLAAAARIIHTQPGPGLRRDRIMGLCLVDDDDPVCSPSRLENMSLVDEETGRTRENICLVDDETRSRESAPQGGGRTARPSRQNPSGRTTGTAGKRAGNSCPPFPRVDAGTPGIGRDFALVDDEDSRDSLRNIPLVDLTDEELGRNCIKNDDEEESGWGIGGLIRRMLGKVFGKKTESSSHKKLLELSLNPFASEGAQCAAPPKNEPASLAPSDAETSVKSSRAQQRSNSLPSRDEIPPASARTHSWYDDDEAPLWTPPSAQTTEKPTTATKIAQTATTSAVTPAAQTARAVVPLSPPSLPKAAARETPPQAPPSSIQPETTSRQDSWDSDDDDAPVWTPPAPTPATPEAIASPSGPSVTAVSPSSETDEGETHIITLSGGVRNSTETTGEEPRKPGLLGWITKLLRREDA